MAFCGCCNTRVRIAFAIIGVLVGLSVFPVFAFVFGNWGAAVWGLTSGVIAAVTLGVHIQFGLDEWKTRSYWLKTLMLIGCFAQLAGVCGFVTYLALAINTHQGLVVYGPGYFITCVWCMMTWKWGFMLFYYSRFYKRHFEASTGINSDISYEKI